VRASASQGPVDLDGVPLDLASQGPSFIPIPGSGEFDVTAGGNGSLNSYVYGLSADSWNGLASDSLSVSHGRNAGDAGLVGNDGAQLLIYDLAGAGVTVVPKSSRSDWLWAGYSLVWTKTPDSLAW
jgi:hypothetical protein